MIAATLTIDLGAVRRNVARLRAFVSPAGIAAVVKSNAYGHGLVPVARAIEADVDRFCVYRADEASTLREAGIARPILVLGPVASGDLDGVLGADAEIALWSTGTFLADATRAARTHGTRVGAHAKIDSGVTRLGLDVPDAAAAIAAYVLEPHIALRGAFTHLAAAEELESAFTLDQLARFERALAPVDALLRPLGTLRHAAASAAAMLYPALRLDFVRAGIAIYGIWPSPQTQAALRGRLDLEPALAWTSELVVVRAVEAGRSVGYGCTYVTTRPSRIGVVPIGYAEGVPRAISGRGTVLVEGVRVPIVGRVCMNMCFVDVTGVPAAHTGSRVTLVGSDGSETIDANAFAEDADTIGYELVARLPAEIPRAYNDSEPAEALTRSFSVPDRTRPQPRSLR